MDTTFYYVYKITHIPSNRFYIGRRIFVGTNISLDSYMGSGVKITKLMKKHHISEFLKEILFVFSNSEDMIAKEINLISDNIEDPDCLNLCVGDAYTVGMIRQHLESRKKTSLSMLGSKNPMFEKTHNEETKRSMALAKIGKIALFKDGKMIKRSKSELLTYFADGWVPGKSHVKKYLDLCPTLSEERSELEKNLWKNSEFRVAKSRVDR